MFASVMIGAIVTLGTPVAPVAHAVPACQVYVTSGNSNVVSVIDTSTSTVTPVAVGAPQVGVAFNRTGTKVFVGTNPGVRMIDVATRAVTAVNNIDGGLIAASPTANVILVGSFYTNQYYRLDSETGAAIGTAIASGDSPIRAVFSPDGLTAYATNYNNNTHEVDKINMSNFTSSALSLEVNGNDFAQPNGIAISSDGSKLYVVARLGLKIREFNTNTSNVSATIVPAGGPSDVATVPNSSRIIFTESGLDRVAIYDTANQTLTANVNVGANPVSVVVSPDGLYAFVVNNWSNTVSRVDLSTNSVVETFSVTTSPRQITIGPSNCSAAIAPPPAVVPIWRVSMDPAGGECVDGTVSHDTEWTSVFVGYRYLPGAADCSRDGYSFSGWADSEEPEEVLTLPFLTDPSDDVKRWFVSSNHSLVAVWKKLDEDLDDLRGTTPGAFVGGPDRVTAEGGGVVDGYYIPPGTQFGPWMLAIPR